MLKLIVEVRLTISIFLAKYSNTTPFWEQTDWAGYLEGIPIHTQSVVSYTWYICVEVVMHKMQKLTFADCCNVCNA